MTYNWPRSDVYAYLGVPLELVPALEKSAADLPDEYDPPYRLAWILLKANSNYDSPTAEKAAQWAEKAIAKAYGPRKAKALGLLADCYLAMHDVGKELDAAQRQLEFMKTLPANQVSADAIKNVETRVTALQHAGN